MFPYQFYFQTQYLGLIALFPCKSENSDIGFIIGRMVNMNNYTFRLKPGDDLFNSIERFVQRQGIEAGCILCGVGSLKHVALRFANRDYHSEFDGYFEIVSVTGTVSIHGSHIHISISDGDGKTMGGHLVPGCKIYTTAEIVLGVFEGLVYKRELLENDSGYEELVVHPRQV